MSEEKLSKEELEAYYGDPVDPESPFERLTETSRHLSLSSTAPDIARRGGGIPTEQVKFALLDWVEDPFQSKNEIADRWGIDRGAFVRALRIYGPWLEKESERVWRAKKPLAMRKMEELALNEKNFKALEFILRSNGINPVQKVEGGQDINVTVTAPKLETVEEEPVDNSDFIEVEYTEADEKKE